MTVSMRLMTAGEGYKYLLKSVVAGDGERHLSTPLTRYYTEQGCPPGSWIGSGLRSLGERMIEPGDEVTEAQLQLLIGQGIHPVTGETLGQAYYKFQTRERRIANRVDRLPETLTDAERAAQVELIETEERERGERRTVAGFDYTFSVPKSVSVLWGVSDAGTQALIAQAHHDSVADVIDFMEREVVCTRSGISGRGAGVVQVDVTGVLATAFDHYDSRAGDPQLHTHCVISNKVASVFDGRWRSVDSRPMHAAVVTLSEHYNAVLADRLARVLGVGWDQRDRGRNHNPAWEIEGVGEDLIKEFSSRSGDIDAEAARRVAEYRASHGRQPSRRMIIKLREQAALATRPDKQIRSLADLTAEWRQRAAALIGGDATEWARQVVEDGEAVVLRADDVPLDVVAHLGESVVQVVGEKRSTWRRWNLHAEASRQTMGWRFATAQDREAVVALIVDAAEDRSLRLTPAELSAPAEFQRPDGSSRFRPKHMTLYSSQALLDAEDRLLDLGRTLTAPTVAPDTVAGLVDTPDGRGRLLGPDQAAALTSIATSGRVVDVLVGPAGAGKTTALSRLRAAWEAEHGGGSVVGLAPSATAAAVLAEDLGIACENTARWLAEHDHLGRDFQPGQLVICDEASLAGTFTLDRITALAAQAGAKVLLVGDYAQLQAVDAGGAFTMLVADRHDAPELTDIHRFRSEWEKPASLGLRHGRANVIDAYLQHGRVTEGDHDDVTEAAYLAWRDDAREGLAALLVADSHETVREMNQRARHERILAGLVDPDEHVTLHDGSLTSAGDVVITRRNDRHLVAGKTGWVRNGDRWTVVKTHSDGAVTLRRAGRLNQATVILPAAYAAEHLDLGYAVTAHRAQGVTVDRCHTVVTPSTTRENLYVAMTRGRYANLAYVAVDKPDQTHDLPHPSDNPDADARAVLCGVLRNSGAELSAHQAIAAEAEEWGNATQICAEYETLLAAAERDRWAALVADCGLDQTQVEQVLASEAFGALCAELGRAEANGLDPDTALPKLVAARSMAGASDIASVLHERFTRHSEHAQADRRLRPRPQQWVFGLIRKPTASISPVFTQALVEREAALRNRASEVVRRAIQTGEAWAMGLGSQPTDPLGARRWAETALAVAAYRDRYQVEGSDALGSPSTARQAEDAARVRATAGRHTPPPRTPHGNPVSTMEQLSL
ncbi:MAG: relaxase domain-containing protein [Bifidobacteriaceae bacterium]|nr:relaxase domain-containing protein [Bifidobacteriaceae bacterium]